MVNEIRFLHNEKELIEQINEEASVEFQEHYVKFAAQKGVDIKQLNKQHEERIQEIYNTNTPKISSEKFYRQFLPKQKMLRKK